MLGLLDMHWSLLHPNDQISLYCFQAFHCDAIMGQMLYQFQENQRDNFSNDTFRVQKNLYRALLEAYNSDKDLLFSYGKVVTLKRGRDDQDEDKEPFAGLNRTTRSPPKSSGKSVQEEEHDPRVDDLEEPFHQEFDTGNDDVSLVREATDVDERLWNPSGSRTPDREWNQTKTVDDRHPQQCRDGHN
ncbi:hypothetical protein Tco_0374970 [Tanacetum coccineum]